jgi:uncharacterized membrane protein
LDELSVSARAAAADNTERCYGVAKGGKNDCAGAAHACAGPSRAEATSKEFIEVPEDVCERLHGCNLTNK